MPALKQLKKSAAIADKYSLKFELAKTYEAMLTLPEGVLEKTGRLDKSRVRKQADALFKECGVV